MMRNTIPVTMSRCSTSFDIIPKPTFPFSLLLGMSRTYMADVYRHYESSRKTTYVYLIRHIYSKRLARKGVHISLLVRIWVATEVY
jgi:hypothetical protein